MQHLSHLKDLPDILNYEVSLSPALPKHKITNKLEDTATTGISSDLFSNFKLFANFTSAAYCPQNEDPTAPAGTPITCPGNNCTLVSADKTTSVIQFGA